MRPLQTIRLPRANDLPVLDGAQGDHGATPPVSASVAGKVKPKRCRTCRREFVPARPLQACCSAPCAISYSRFSGEKRLSIAQKRAARLEKAELREKRRKSIPLSKLKSQAQHEFNRWVRERDYGRPCISCGRLTGAKMNAGHYRTTKAASHLRFHPDNCHAQCEHCNTYLSGNLIEYRKGLLAKIGAARVELLEDDNRTLKWTREDLIGIRKEYLSKWKELVAAREAGSD